MLNRLDIKIYISIVSHNQSSLAYDLVVSLLKNTSAVVHYIENDPHAPLINLSNANFIPHHNDDIKGFGENHNFAFKNLNTREDDIFIICNPDISFNNTELNKFTHLCNNIGNELSTIRIIDNHGYNQDNIRANLNLPNLLFRHVFRINLNITEKNFWFAGMFLFCKSKVYKKLDGFDDSFFLYCEDADICYRARRLNIKLNVYKDISFIHNARRDSKRKAKYFFLHVKSLLKFWFKYGFLFHK